jgi:hypothetical protein
MKDLMHMEEDVRVRLRNYNALQRYKKQKDAEKTEPVPYGIIRFYNGNCIMPKTQERYNAIRNEYVWQIKFAAIY